MHFSNSIYHRLITISILFAVFVLIAMIVFGIMEYRQSEMEMQKKVPLLFEHSISEEVKLKMEGVFVSINMTNDPAETKEKVREETIITEDTTITKEVGIDNDYNKQLLKTSQSYLLYMNRLHPDTLQQIFQSKLAKDGIRAHPLVLVKHGDISEISDDSMQYRICYRTPIVKGGSFEEITYESLLSYGPGTIIRLMPKKKYMVLFVLAGIALLFCYRMFVQKRKINLEKIIPDNIIPEKIIPNRIIKNECRYHIGQTQFDTNKNELITGEKVINVPSQSAGLLLMFVESENHAVKKNAILEKYWPKSGTAYNNMTSSVNKLRALLKEADCDFSITTKKMGDHYTLKYKGEKT